ncbi:MAG: phosphodiester glycosidase family protein [Flavobacteriia bacterium]|nr:phosphodiester glycosidase family protein [Flavobacteriia bacterium]
MKSKIALKNRFLSPIALHLFFLFSIVQFVYYAQNNSNPTLFFEWKKICNGLETAEFLAPKKSILGDSKITVVKINPNHFEIEMHTAGNEKKKPYTVEQWSDSFRLNIVFNAAMYELSNPLKSRGYLKNKQYLNKSEVHPSFNAAICFNPYQNDSPKMDIVDLTNTSISELSKKYSCIVQSLRMIDHNGNPVFWKKKAQSCSMLVAAVDKDKNFYLIFCRSPYTHNEMIEFLIQFPTKLYNAIYLEGGPQTSLYIDLLLENEELICIEKVGSFVSETYPTNKNMQFWELPNIIGLRLRK